MGTRKPLIAGNWKMFGKRADLVEIEKTLAAASHANAVEILFCPPATLVAEAAKFPVAIGGQDCHANTEGAHTGDISAVMLADSGARYVIVGHSERRRDHGEPDEIVAAKARAALAAGLIPIICVGETLVDREAGRTLDVVGAQLAGSVPAEAGDKLVVAYEPVWAIGTGLTPTSEQIAEVHADIRRRLVMRIAAEGEKVRILYGGSVKPGNAREIFGIDNVDGALVGGASLKAADFSAIIMAHPAAGV
ncbi:MAG: triose-phosphate isomerase [Caulobacterales bacterium]